jgi:3-methyladenine DNA glycosylase AlkD
MEVLKSLREKASEERRLRNQSYFKMGPGQYSEGDVFIGVSMPDIRSVVKSHPETTMKEVETLIQSQIHEERMTALIFLVTRYPKNREEIYRFYLKHMHHVNNWDLVDLSAPHIVGAYHFGRGSDKLYEWALSENLWVRRISVVATQHFIKKGLFEPTLRLAEMLLKDEEDLMHKAVGWMLREVGKKDERALEGFLERFVSEMPRTMLRYSLERLEPEKRRYFMSK